MAKFRIKNERLRKLLYTICYCEDYVQMEINEQYYDDSCKTIKLHSDIFHKIFTLEKSEVERIFDPDDWNPWPEVTPPKNGSYLATVIGEKGEPYTKAIYFYDGGLFGLWRRERVTAFRALPEPYKPPQEQD